ncbi:MAG TPA: hypothetical protein VGK18_11735 [Propionicimonas sp.]|uniref:hypothetical protein n=1 Tax=Propionicimonas sp. TaxID=1955623 RepID=UPI002F413B7A
MTDGGVPEIAGPRTRTPRSRALGLFIGLVAGALAAVGLWAWWANSALLDLEMALAGLSGAGALLLFPFRTRWIGVGAVIGAAPFWLFIIFVKWSLSRFVLF